MTSKHLPLHSVNQKYNDYKVTKVLEISELQCHLTELVHEPTGAYILHIGNEDPENLFCLSFQTLPYNSNGVAHILEHTVLCGSKKFPVKDPFFAMNRRSLNTFMNALTGADFTCYPAATQVPKDFYNLLEVYLDAVFFPNLNELSFLQEGVRLEFSDPQDVHSPLEFKGIVYNEMKGALSSGSARLFETLNHALFPQITYGFNSGGDPNEIPTLSYEELIAFHHLYYHPSRCIFFFYGNMPLKDHLDFLDQHLLKNSKKVPPLPPIPLQPRFTQPKKIIGKYPIAPDEDPSDKTMIAFGWLTCHILDQLETLALNVLEIALLDTDASPLKMALLKSGLCKQVNCFIDTEINEIPFGIILKGCNEKNAEDLELVIIQTLELICEQGLSIEMIENSIHQLEFARSEITGDQAPFGLSLFMRSALLKHHGVDPEQGLIIHTLFEQIRQKALEDGQYYIDLIKKHLLNNTHFVRLAMLPDKELQDLEEQKEKELLAKLKEKLTSKDALKIVKHATQLATFQEEQAKESLDILPKVTINEVPLISRHYPLIQNQVGVLNTLHHNTFTNDILYADLAFNLPHLPEDDLTYLRLLTVILTQVGCNGRNYVENLDYMQGHTGGVGAGISLNLQADDYQKFNPTFHLRGKSLYRKVPKLFSLMLDTIESADFDDLERIKEIVLKHYTGIESRINQSALKYAINLSSSGLSISSKVANDLYGLPYYWTLKEIVQNFDQQSSFFISKLKELQEKVLSIEKPDLIISGNAKIYDKIKSHEFYGLSQLNTNPYTPWIGDYPLISNTHQGRVIASSVAFIGKVFPTVSYTHRKAPALSLAAYLFDNLTLHQRIREQGGAYGGGSVSNPLSGQFYFYSYRDPNIHKTLQAFQEAIDSVANGDFDDEDLNEAKLEMIQTLDSPVAPGSRGEVEYGRLKEGRTPAIRQHFRAQLLSLKREDIIEAVQTIIIPNYKLGTTVVFAGKQLLEEENQKMKADGFPILNIESI